MSYKRAKVFSWFLFFFSKLSINYFLKVTFFPLGYPIYLVFFQTFYNPHIQINLEYLVYVIY